MLCDGGIYSCRYRDRQQSMTHYTTTTTTKYIIISTNSRLLLFSRPICPVPQLSSALPPSSDDRQNLQYAPNSEELERSVAPLQMGQQVGKCSAVEPFRPFVNLSHDACLRLWEAFHDIAEGFGLQCDEAQEICETLLRDMTCEREELDAMVESMFHVLDTDENGLVDALEFMVTLALLSGMSLKLKAEFCFNVFDFDESKVMSIDEVCLMFKQGLSGCAKGTASMPPSEKSVSIIAEEVFRKFDRQYDEHVSREEVVSISYPDAN